MFLNINILTIADVSLCQILTGTVYLVYMIVLASLITFCFLLSFWFYLYWCTLYSMYSTVVSLHMMDDLMDLPVCINVYINKNIYNSCLLLGTRWATVCLRQHSRTFCLAASVPQAIQPIDKHPLAALGTGGNPSRHSVTSNSILAKRSEHFRWHRPHNRIQYII